MKCKGRVKSKTGKRFGGTYQCSRNAYPGFNVCRQHGARTPEEMNADYLVTLALKKGEEVRAEWKKKQEADTAAYNVAEEKATRLTRMAPQLLKLLEDLLVADMDEDHVDQAKLLDEAWELVAFIKNKCSAEGCDGVYQHLACPTCGGAHCPGH